MRVSTLICPALAAAALIAGCSSEPAVDTDEPAAAPPAPTSAAPTPPPSNVHLVNAFDYVAYPPNGASYFFTSPSGAWACAIVPRVKAGCQSATNWPSALGIAGAPQSLPTATGEAATPNAVVVERDADPHFAALEAPEFALESAAANTLPFNRILAVAGFRCNVQEVSGISCLSERSGNGFTFSADGFAPQYTDVPPGAP